MFSITPRRAGLAGLATTALAAVLVTAAPTIATADRADRIERVSVSAAEVPTGVEHQSGIVLEAAGDGVLVTVYENSKYGNSATVVLGDPDAGHFGYVEQTEPFVVDGQLNLVVDVEGTTVSISGSVAPNGKPAKVVEPQQDGGEQIVTRGTNTPLAAELMADVAGEVVVLHTAPAFAYDLEVRKVALYGN
jgi:hypothetical protein